MADYDDDDDDMGAGEGIAGADYREVEIREQDRYLPIANIARIMKRVLPGNTKIAKDAKESIQACVSEFISFITSEASDKCQLEKRKTINGDDLLWAMSTLGFDKYVEPLKVYLAKYREAVKGDKPEKDGKGKGMGDDDDDDDDE
jgi:nuclear transcription Y subunit beta